MVLAAALTVGCSVLDGPISSAGIEAPPAHRESAPARLSRPSLSEIFSLLMAANPELSTLRARARAAAGSAEQADTTPNPVLSGGPMFGFGGGPTEVEGGATLSQKVEIGKRGPRVREGLAGHGVAVAAYRAVAADLALETTLVYNEILALQQSISIKRHIAGLASEIEKLERKKERAGASSREVALGAAMAASKAAREVRDAQSDLDSACRRLEALLDLPRKTIAGVSGAFTQRSPFPPGMDLQAMIPAGNPSIALATARTGLARATLERERTRPIPDVTVSASWAHRMRKEEGAIEMAGFGLGFPIPLFDAGGAAVSAARENVVAAEESERTAMAAARRQLETSMEAFEKATARASTQVREILPDLEALLELARRSRDAGRSSDPEVLRIESTLAAARLELVNFSREAEDALAGIARAVGATTEDLPGK